MLTDKGAKQGLREEVENKYDKIKMKRKAENTRNMKGRPKVRRKMIRTDIYFVEVPTIKTFALSCLAALHE
jgi:hypothetical protein